MRYVIDVPASEIAESKIIAQTSIKHNGDSLDIHLSKYRARILAYSERIPGQVLGFLDFMIHTGYANLISHMVNTSEISYLQVEPAIMRSGLGTILLNTAEDIISDSGNDNVLVRAERPGEEDYLEGRLSREERDRRYPFSTSQLIEFYQKRGYRLLTEDEIDHYMVFLSAFASSRSQTCVKPPPVPQPAFGDGLFDRILKHLHNRNYQIAQPWIRGQVDKRRDWGSYRRELRRREKEARENCENILYLRRHLIKDLRDT
jgi:ribosomal protein S18 acetylase RimI-like enzyme